MKRKYEIKFITEVETETNAEGLKKCKEEFKMFNAEVKPVISSRTQAQNNALHLLFSQLADELNGKGLDMRHLIRAEVDISWTTYSVKEYLWRPLQKILTGKKSTTKLNKTEEIELVYNNLNRILIERTKGEISLPPFPSYDIDN